ncbi:hypothetical protein M9Y10_001211 [Tritrichomonas musculus]|uniref:CYTH domain-containing protein n=1 Tax=Tritrichomonas musculus TaxID=1915356 RepID=A0ABR2L6D9_9EUKA
MTEIEIKLSLSESDYGKVIDHFKSSLKETLDQWNIFFDTSSFDLIKTKSNLRLRRILSDKSPEKWFLTCKQGGKMVNGVALKPEYETEITPELGKYLITAPPDLFSKLPAKIQEPISFAKDWKFQIIGDFRTVRRVIPFEGTKIEADESFLPNSTKFYEIEVESEHPEELKPKIEQKLNEIGAKFTNSSKGKMRRLLELPDNLRFSRKSYVIE